MQFLEQSQIHIECISEWLAGDFFVKFSPVLCCLHAFQMIDQIYSGAVSVKIRQAKRMHGAANSNCPCFL